MSHIYLVDSVDSSGLDLNSYSSSNYVLCFEGTINKRTLTSYLEQASSGSFPGSEAASSGMILYKAYHNEFVFEFLKITTLDQSIVSFALVLDIHLKMHHKAVQDMKINAKG